jgi:hypothetical protein
MAYTDENERSSPEYDDVRERMYHEPTSSDFIRLSLSRTRAEHLSSDPKKWMRAVYKVRKQDSTLSQMFDDFVYDERDPDDLRCPELNKVIRKMIDDKELVRTMHEKYGAVFTMPDEIKQQIARELSDLDVAYITEIGSISSLLRNGLEVKDP